MIRTTQIGVCESCERWSFAAIGEVCQFCGVATVRMAQFGDDELQELDLDDLLGSHTHAEDEN